MYFRATDLEAIRIMQTLSDYGQATGQRINLAKSSISFSKNVDPLVQNTICMELGVTCKPDHGHYLGLPSFIVRKRKMAFEFIKDRVWSKFLLEQIVTLL